MGFNFRAYPGKYHDKFLQKKKKKKKKKKRKIKKKKKKKKNAKSRIFGSS